MLPDPTPPLRHYFTHLSCTACGLRHEAEHLQNLCTACAKPLFPVYDLAAAGETLTRTSLATRTKSLWRYREMLPLPPGVEPVTFGEGGTPLLHAPRFGAAAGLEQLWVKDEAQNPTQSFKARGMAVAVSMAKHLGATKLAVPTAGNAGGALAAYAARAGLEAHIFMPRDTPRANIIECRELGAHVTLLDGLITDCGAEIARRKEAEGWFDMSTLKEPYRVEGKKTLGYELAEQLSWELPDVVIYPTGGGTGLIGMWKAFDEMEALGWIGSKRPRMYAIQASGCAPIVRAFEAGEEFAERWEGAARPGHFTGVLTVVAKLFHLAEPDVACFGQKDFQQAVLVRQMVRDLDWPLELAVVPTVREPDGLALSSRNVYLDESGRRSALGLSAALGAAHQAWREGERNAAAIEARARGVLEKHPGLAVEYVAVVDPETLEPASQEIAETIVALAGRVGRTRLIDNIILGQGLV